FFQAEDGIRDFHVTGVQTCALPICPILRFVNKAGAFRLMTRTTPNTNKTTDAAKYQMPNKKRKLFSRRRGMKPSLMMEAPLPKMDKKMSNNPISSSFNWSFTFFFVFFRFFFLDTFFTPTNSSLKSL